MYIYADGSRRACKDNDWDVEPMISGDYRTDEKNRLQGADDWSQVPKHHQVITSPGRPEYGGSLSRRSSPEKHVTFDLEEAPEYLHEEFPAEGAPRRAFTTYRNSFDPSFSCQEVI